MKLQKQMVAWFFGALILMMASALQAQEAAGTAVSVRGYVTATSSNGDVRQLKRGDEVYSGDTIETARRSRVRMLFTDGSTNVLTSRAVFEITDYSFSGQEDGTERASFKLVQGALEAISGLIGKKNKGAFRLDTPFATIGLRGTMYKVEILQDQNGNRFLNLSVAGGSVIYSSPGLTPVSVATGQSLSQQNGQQPQSQQGIIVTEFTVTADGEDQAEDWIDVLFNTEVITEEDKEAALDALQGVNEADNTSTQDTSSEEPNTEETSIEPLPIDEQPPATTTPEIETIESIINDPDGEIPLTDEQAEQIREETRQVEPCPIGQIVSPSAPGGCAPL